MHYRLIATDLDDTLLNEDSQVSERNCKAIKRAVEVGVRFVIATGRMFKTSVTYLEEIGLNGDCPLINYHGALVKTALSKRIMFHRPLDNDLAVAVVQEAEKQQCHVSLFVDDDLYINKENEYSRFYQTLAKIDPLPVGRLSSFLKNNSVCPTKISIIRWDGDIDSIEHKLRKSFGKKLSILQSRPYFLEITEQKATKGQTLRWLAEQEGIRPEEIIAFGDGHNDLDMLDYAGLGVAVANARSELLAIADLVTSSNSADGVAEVIEKYVLDGSGL